MTTKCPVEICEDGLINEHPCSGDICEVCFGRGHIDKVRDHTLAQRVDDRLQGWPGFPPPSRLFESDGKPRTSIGLAMDEAGFTEEPAIRNTDIGYSEICECLGLFDDVEWHRLMDRIQRLDQRGEFIEARELMVVLLQCGSGGDYDDIVCRSHCCSKRLCHACNNVLTGRDDLCTDCLRAEGF